MLQIDKQRRIVLGIDFPDAKEVYLHVASLKDKNHLMVSLSEEADWYMLAKISMDNKKRVIIPKDVATFLGWKEGDHIIRAKHLGKMMLIKNET